MALSRCPIAACLVHLFSQLYSHFLANRKPFLEAAITLQHHMREANRPLYTSCYMT